KALALGATAVGIGRPYLYGLGIGGSEGVTRVVDILRREFEMTMMLTGRPTLASIDRSLLWPKSGESAHLVFLDIAHLVDDALEHALHRF
ncbi:MAG TPA: alpha-hydroxy-acid oxidizing protein, partial [Bryobacteraceae bacterium]|nr:alpha-hydroxy-acid oxidizing protein [Bryobacteraceae bacterium]